MWQSREGTADSYRPPLKCHAPIASLAALPERHAGWAVCAVLLLWRNAPKVVIPRSEATWESPAGSCDFADSFPTVQLGTARLPRRPLASSQ